ncbi:hypothetical protein [Gulosibacter sp. 10]|uniref:hypothetical protein n=1 Tax=Gulosibacter sp. 10 TaxID=1255570 RepID=UPI00097F4EEA|nr:hypothetical protein [Gulosibacter sp. 10]SJM64033.1 UPF0135 protein Bsu YqfO @ Bsu YqfO NIF3/CutA domain [Gulosibacter sp. 10]
MGGGSLVVIVIYVPTEHAGEVRRALDEAGAGRIGDYRGCSWSTPGMGRFTPLDGARPAIGAVGEPEEVPEDRIEAVAPREAAREILEAALAAHPYEEPAHHVIPVLTAGEL